MGRGCGLGRTPRPLNQQKGFISGYHPAVFAPKEPATDRAGLPNRAAS